MNLFDVYPVYNITPVKARGCYVYDEKNTAYLDLYGGHGVISIGHTHETFVKAINEQINKIAFYSNSILNPLQEALAEKLGKISGCENYRLFLCNSGAEANENALKMASFHTGRKRVIAFDNAFHGRTSAAVAVTDNPAINAALNRQQATTFLPLNEIGLVENEIKKGDVCAVIIEGIQGVGGLDEGSTEFFRALETLCKKEQVVLILDEIQSGYGRSGNFFAFQHHGISPDIITTAKGMGNGFPIGGVLISDQFTAKHGMLGTTFGGNHLACAAALSVIEVIENEELMDHIKNVSTHFIHKAGKIPQVKKIKGRGLMLGLEFDFEVSALRKELIYEKHIFTGAASNKKLLRILPPLNISSAQLDYFLDSLIQLLESADKKVQHV